MSDKAMVHSGSASIPVEGGSTISARLAAYGISHEAAKDGCRYLFWRGKSIGTADVFQAITLLNLLDAAREDWDKREKSFPPFTRQTWDQGTDLAKSIAILKALEAKQ